MRAVFKHQIDMTGINYHLAGMFKHDGDFAGYVRLHLPPAPIGLERVAHEHARFKNVVNVAHFALQWKECS